MELTPAEKAVLAHAVVDPDTWVANTVSMLGEEAVRAKIERWRPYYEVDKDKPNYKNRAVRNAEEEEAKKPTREQVDDATVNTLILQKIRTLAIEDLKKEGKLDANGKIVK